MKTEIFYTHSRAECAPFAKKCAALMPYFKNAANAMRTAFCKRKSMRISIFTAATWG